MAKSARGTRWISVGQFQDLATVDNTVGVTVLAPAEDLVTLVNPTVIRIRGYLQLQLGNTEAANAALGQQAAMGLGIIVLDQNQISGPDPLSTDGADRDWLWLGFSHLRTELNPQIQPDNTGTVVGSVFRADSTGSSWQRFEVDCKAMRKIRHGEEIRLITSFNQTEGAPAIQVDGFFRCLIKE